MSRNISKEKRESLLAKINKLVDFLKSANASNEMITYLTELQNELKRQKFGLVFEEHKETIDKVLETHTPVLKEEKKLLINNGGQINFLIEGDNLAALDLLNRTHKGKIDVIYIDPPYNTGAKNWRYNNNYVDGDDLFRHSKFASFMEKRLRMAYKLLNENGIIICAIDDYEMHNIRHLMDSIFNEYNRLGTVVVVHNPSGRQDAKFFATAHEYMLIYAKKKENAVVGYLQQTEKKLSQYSLEDKFGKYKLRSFVRTGSNSRPNEGPSLFYPLYINPKTFDLSTEKIIGYDKVLPKDSNGQDRVWRWSASTLNKKKEKYIDCKKNKNGYVISVKERENDNKGYKPKTIWNEPAYSSASAIFTLKNIFSMDSKSVFDYPKSTKLMTDILSITSNTNFTILDFFAGSGTTGHAVMGLNREDGGNRRFILCTNNENDICREVTYERIKRVIERENYEASLKYQKIEFLPTAEKDYYDYANELLKHIRELVELENGINFIDNNKLVILLTEKEAESFFNSTKIKKCNTIYLGHDVSLNLIQQALLTNYGIIVNIIPEYYYKDK
jgi:adenine-specific DNA-methyltransferase